MKSFGFIVEKWDQILMAILNSYELWTGTENGNGNEMKMHFITELCDGNEVYFGNYTGNGNYMENINHHWFHVAISSFYTSISILYYSGQKQFCFYLYTEECLNSEVESLLSWLDFDLWQNDLQHIFKKLKL